MKKLVLLCIFTFAALSCTPSFAGTIFNFSFSGSGIGFLGSFSGAGQFDTQATGISGQYKITGVTGTTAGQSITTLLAAGSYGGNDNLLFYPAGSATASLDYNGVSYQLANGSYTNLYLNTYNSPGSYQEMMSFQQQSAAISITPVAVAAVSEPTTLLLLGTGILGGAVFLRRRTAV
jgi:PEP-CTERM motif-containing protein